LRTYETLFIVQPNATDEEVEAVTNGVENLVTSDGGVIAERDIWGKRRLAYEVKKFTEGIYVLVRFQSDAEVVQKLENNFKLNDDVIRYLVVHFDPKTLRLEEEQKKRQAERAERRESSGRDDDSRARPREARGSRDRESGRDRDREREVAKESESEQTEPKAEEASVEA